VDIRRGKPGELAVLGQHVADLGILTHNDGVRHDARLHLELWGEHLQLRPGSKRERSYDNPGEQYFVLATLTRLPLDIATGAGYHGYRMNRIRVNISLSKLELIEVRAIQKSLTTTDGWNLPVTTLLRNAALHHLRGIAPQTTKRIKSAGRRAKVTVI